MTIFGVDLCFLFSSQEQYFIHVHIFLFINPRKQNSHIFLGSGCYKNASDFHVLVLSCLVKLIVYPPMVKESLNPQIQNIALNFSNCSDVFFTPFPPDKKNVLIVRAPLLQHARTRAATKCSATTPPCGSTCTLTGPESTCARSAARPSSSPASWSDTSWSTPGRSRSSAPSRAAGRGSVSISIWGEIGKVPRSSHANRVLLQDSREDTHGGPSVRLPVRRVQQEICSINQFKKSHIDSCQSKVSARFI